MQDMDVVAEELNDSVCKAIELFDTIEGTMSFPISANNDVRSRDIFVSNLLDYMLYLASVDGDPGWDECFLIGQYVGDASLTPQKVKELMTGKMSSDEYFRKMPEIMLLCKLYNDILKTNHLDDIGTQLANTVIQIYEFVGNCLLKSDDNVSSNEVRLYNMYIEMIHDYDNYDPN